MSQKEFWQRLAIAAIPAIIAGFLAFIAAERSRLSPKKDEPEVQLQLVKVKKGATEKKAAPPELRQNRKPNDLYQADTAGFVIAFTGGDTPANYADIRFGPTEETMSVCSRMLRYDGAICPVPQGWHWTVSPRGEPSGTVVVQWFPFVPGKQ